MRNPPLKLGCSENGDRAAASIDRAELSLGVPADSSLRKPLSVNVRDARGAISLRGAAATISLEAAQADLKMMVYGGGTAVPAV
jgi:hypothetical protein